MRPLTAADRKPEPGDVLAMMGRKGQFAAKVIFRRGDGMLTCVFTEKRSNPFYTGCSESHVYKSRADGGEVTTDAPEPGD